MYVLFIIPLYLALDMEKCYKINLLHASGIVSNDKCVVPRPFTCGEPNKLRQKF